MTTSGKIPKVSVIVPVFNHERYVVPAVRSILDQSFGDFEVIAIDDGSQDRSGELIKAIDDARLTYMYHQNQGASRTLNRGIEMSRGEYVSILNSDDLYHSERLQACLDVLEGDHSIQAVFTYLDLVDEEGRLISATRGPEEYWKDLPPDISFSGEDNRVLDLLAGNFLLTTSNLFCRREVFETVGYFSHLRYAHDYDFFLRLCSRLKVHLIEKPLVNYRIHSLNTVKENEATVCFEVGLVIANFFLHTDLRTVLPHESARADMTHSLMVKLFNSVNTRHTERLVMTLLLWGINFPEQRDDLLASLAEDRGNPFRQLAVGHVEEQFEAWRHAQEGWDRWDETNKKLISKEEELHQAWQTWDETQKRLINMEKLAQEGWSKLDEANKKLISREEDLRRTEEDLRRMEDTLRAVLGSISFRLGRALTSPARRLRDFVNSLLKT